MKITARILLAAALALLVAGCDNAATTAATPAKPAVTVGVSEVKANPGNYLGAIAITGRAAKVYAEDGVIEIADEKACCAVYLFVPFTEAQKEKLKMNALYKGALPAIGTPITVTGELSEVTEGYHFQVHRIVSGEEVLIAKL